MKPAPDPREQARQEFEVLAGDYAVGTHKLYSRGDFSTGPDAADIKKQLDEGDFIGRLRTLFGPSEGNEYVLRHKATGYVITAYAGGSGPSFGGGWRFQGALPPPDPKVLLANAFNRPEDPAVAARKAADPVLAPGTATPTSFEKLAEYRRHLTDAEVGPELAGAVRRLASLIEAVPPADWEETQFYDEGPVVYRVGAKHAKSFNVELPPDEAFAWLADRAESRDPNERDELGGVPYDADSDLLLYYGEHVDELRTQRARALAAYKRLVRAADSHSPELRNAILEEARDFARKLGVPPP